MTYDDWKTRSPDDELDIGEPPEVWIVCDECGGEGSIEIPEIVSKWSIDPPGSYCVPCKACGGVGGFIDEASGDPPHAEWP